MDLINQIGISYKSGYLVQGNQLERCKTSTKLQAYNTELQMRSDGKDFNITNILKLYGGNIIFHAPAININLSNLKNLESKIKKLVENNIKMITIDASNLSLDLFEWSTIEEQKKYFLNIVTGIATLASNKIVVAVENTNSKDGKKFGYNISQVSDTIFYSRKLLVKDFGFSEEEASEYIGLCLNVNPAIDGLSIDTLDRWFKISNIKCIKFSKSDDNYDALIDKILNLCLENDYSNPILFETTLELEMIADEYKYIDGKIKTKLKENDIKISQYKMKPISSTGFSNIIVISIIVITIAIAILMVIVKIKG